jgi:hypothetical protein
MSVLNALSDSVLKLAKAVSERFEYESKRIDALEAEIKLLKQQQQQPRESFMQKLRRRS